MLPLPVVGEPSSLPATIDGGSVVCKCLAGTSYFDEHLEHLARYTVGISKFVRLVSRTGMRGCGLEQKP